MRNIFVDGYNVINSWKELNNIKNYSFESARQKLIEKLNNYAVYKGDKIFIVFDAHMVSGNLEKKEIVNNHIVIVFTKEGETADSFIEKAVNGIGRKTDVCVVTSDNAEQQLVFQRGAARMSSIEFYNEVKEVESKIRSKIQKKYSDKRNVLEDFIHPDVLEKLEKIRRSK